MSTADIEAIRRLDVVTVGTRLGIIDRDCRDPRVSRPGSRYWSWRDSKDSAYVEVQTDGRVYYDHKHKCGGTCIDLVMQHMSPERSYVDGARFHEAVMTIAKEFGLLRSFRDDRARARKITPSRVSRKPEIKAMQEMSELNKASPRRDEAFKVWSALRLDPHRITVAAVPGTGLSWCPSVPWQGAREHLDKFGQPAGWTRAKAESYQHDPDALRLMVIDIDGYVPDDGGDAIYPRLDLVFRLIGAMARHDVPASAVLASSWDHDSEDASRAKVHIYIRARQRASDAGEYETWAMAAAAVARDIVSNWQDVSDIDRKALTIDYSPLNVGALIRCPGYESAKAGATAGVAIHLDPDAEFDGRRMVETQDVMFETRWGPGQCFYRRVYIGRVCKIVERIEGKDGEPRDTTAHFGADIWPLDVYHDGDTDEHGVRYCYISSVGEFSRGQMPAAAFTDARQGKAFDSRAAAAGVKIAPGKGGFLARTLGEWQSYRRRPAVVLASKNGWQDDGKAFVNGTHVISRSSRNWRPNVLSEGIRRRSGRSATAEAWQDGVRELATTPGLICALGISLAGPLIEMCRADGFIAHYHGSSSCGKSVALKLASTIWGRPEEYVASWETSATGMETLGAACNSACMCIDEWQRADETSRRDLGRIIHMLSSGTGRIRSNQRIEARRTLTWSSTVLSTGEVSLRETMGTRWQGGHNVRALDVAIALGDSTRDAWHADDLDEFCAWHYGAIGDLWISTIMSARAEIQAARKRWISHIRGLLPDQNAEAGRVADRLAIVGAALEFASTAGVIPHNHATIDDAMVWLQDAVLLERDESWSPPERAYRAIQNLRDTEPARFPQSDEEFSRARNVVAFHHTKGVHQGWFTNRYMLIASDVLRDAGCSAKEFLAWMVSTERMSQQSVRIRHRDVQRRYHQINLDDDISLANDKASEEEA